MLTIFSEFASIVNLHYIVSDDENEREVQQDGSETPQLLSFLPSRVR